jgi:hypothetical protein
MTIGMLKGRIKEIDEYEFFSRVMKALNTSNPESTKAIIMGLPEFQQKQLKDVLQSKRIETKGDGNRNIARKIFKLKRVNNDTPAMQ